MTTAPQAPRKLPIVPILFGVVAIALVAVVVLTFDSGSTSAETGTPVVTGDYLPVFPDNTADPGLGLTIPAVTSTDYAGNEVSISPTDGTAKILLFVAHWCPHCQVEVPVVQDWLNTNPLPAGVELISISTGISSARDNYPPSAWLDRENWTSPVLKDSTASEIGQAFGLPAYPYWVFVGADGQVLQRATGELSTVALDNAAAALAATVGG
jgi:thiol-disulfide isomerase/thioredoxin